MKVAPAKPNRPRIDGAAIGWRNTRGRAKSPYQASVSATSATPAEARSCRSSRVLIRQPLSVRLCDCAPVFPRFPARETYRTTTCLPPADDGIRGAAMARRSLLSSWPLVRQLREGDPLGLGPAVQSSHSKSLTPRIDEAEHVVQSVCPYCAVGCGQLVYVQGGE